MNAKSILTGIICLSVAGVAFLGCPSEPPVTERATPEAVGLTRDGASLALQDAGLQMGTVTEAYSDQHPVGTVIAQNPPAGVMLLPGASVDLTVSLGPEFVTVPDVTGMSEQAAADSLAQALLSVGDVSHEYMLDPPKGTVLSQSPTAGEIVQQGTAVSMTASGGEGNFDWIDHYGGDTDNAFADIAPDGDGVLVCGRNSDPALYAGEARGVVRRYAHDGTLDWELIVDAYAYVYLSALVPLDDGGWLAVGGGSEDRGPRDSYAFAMRLAPSGSLLWQREYGRGSLRDATLLPDGIVVAVGSEINSSDESVPLVLGLDPSGGDETWRLSPDVLSTSVVATSPAGHAAVFAREDRGTPLGEAKYLYDHSKASLVLVSASGQLISQRDLYTLRNEVNDVVALADGYAVVGWTKLPDSTKRSQRGVPNLYPPQVRYVARLDEAGDETWSYRFEYDDGVMIHAITSAANGELLVSGIRYPEDFEEGDEESQVYVFSPDGQLTDSLPIVGIYTYSPGPLAFANEELLVVAGTAAPPESPMETELVVMGFVLE